MNFINKILNQSFNEEQIEKYNSSFVNSVLKNQETDVVYKIKNKNVFILMEYQTKIDYLTSYRILQYGIAIIKSSLDIKMLKNKSYKFPLVIPVVLHKGKQRWSDNEYFEENKEEIKNNLLFYNIIDINDFTEKEFL